MTEFEYQTAEKMKKIDRAIDQGEQALEALHRLREQTQLECLHRERTDGTCNFCGEQQ